VTPWEWLATAQGQELTSAVSGLLLAVTAWFSWRTHEHVKHINPPK
jgi:hypothetical protein